MGRIRIVVVSIVLALVGCIATPEGEVNLPKLQAYIVAAQDTLQGFVVTIDATDPELSADLQKVTNAIQVVRARVDQAVESGTQTIDLVQSIDLALVATSALAETTIEDPAKRAKVVGLATALAGILRIARIELVG